jgi:hypothetical protein
LVDELEVEGGSEGGVAKINESEMEGRPVDVELRPALRKSSTSSLLVCSASFFFNLVLVLDKAPLRRSRLDVLPGSAVSSSSVMLEESQVDAHGSTCCEVAGIRIFEG